MEVIVNYWAILVSMIVSIAIGFMWYGPLFGKKWIKLSGIVMPDPQPSMAKMMTKPIILSLVGAFLMSYVLSFSIGMGVAVFGATGISAGLMAGFWNWLGFIVPVHLNSAGWEGKSWTLFAINTGYWLVFLLVSGAIIGAWM